MNHDPIRSPLTTGAPDRRCALTRSGNARILLLLRRASLPERGHEILALPATLETAIPDQTKVARQSTVRDTRYYDVAAAELQSAQVADSTAVPDTEA